MVVSTFLTPETRSDDGQTFQISFSSSSSESSSSAAAGSGTAACFPFERERCSSTAASSPLMDISSSSPPLRFATLSAFAFSRPSF
jgi:hypothetical protein